MMLLAVCCAMGWLQFGGCTAPSRSEAVVAAVDTISPRTIEVYGEYVGRIRAREAVEVHTRVEGFLEKMHFSEGNYVQRGQTLFTIDPTLYRSAVDRATANLNKALATEQKALRDLERIRPLFEQNAASHLDLDNAEAAYRNARADVAIMQSELQQARIYLSYTEIKAPISGYITESLADIGTLVSPGGRSLLATVVNSDTVRVDFSMSDLDYLNAKKRHVGIGHADSISDFDPYITVTMADGAVYPLRGLVDFAEPRVDQRTGNFGVRAELPNPDHTLLPGETTRVRMLLDVRKGALAVPASAVVARDGEMAVYVVDKHGIADRRVVAIGPEVGDSIIIEDGLSAGDVILADAKADIKPGMRIIPKHVADETR